VQLSVGAVRAKNAKNIMLVIMLDASIGMVMFYFCGWSFAYGGSYGKEGLGNKFIGYGGFALNDLPREDWYMFFFQYTVRSYCVSP
jgi:ammonium transporter, Amt family